MKLGKDNVKRTLKLSVLLHIIRDEMESLAAEGLEFTHALKYTSKSFYMELDKELCAQMTNNSDINTNIFLADQDDLLAVISEFEIKCETTTKEFMPYVCGIDKKLISGIYTGKTPRELAVIDTAYVLRQILNKNIESSEELLDLCNRRIRESSMKGKMRTAIYV